MGKGTWFHVRHNPLWGCGVCGLNRSCGGDAGAGLSHCPPRRTRTLIWWKNGDLNFFIISTIARTAGGVLGFAEARWVAGMRV